MNFTSDFVFFNRRRTSEMAKKPASDVGGPFTKRARATYDGEDEVSLVLIFA